MPFLPVKCPNCDGNIELDDQREKGFCMYCGSQIVYKEAVQKMELSGVVSVQGIAGHEKLLQNVETFVKLREYRKAGDILLNLTDNYPEDYHGWWQLAMFAINCPFIDSKYSHLISSFRHSTWKLVFEQIFHATYGFDCEEHGYDLFKNHVYYSPIRLIQNAVNTAPLEKVPEMKRKAKEWLQTYSQLYPLRLKYLQEDKISALKEVSEKKERFRKIEACRVRAQEKVNEGRRKLFPKYLQFNDLFTQELGLAGVSEPRLDYRRWNFNWPEDDSGSSTEFFCLKQYDAAEADVKKQLDRLNKQIEEFDA